MSAPTYMCLMSVTVVCMIRDRRSKVCLHMYHSVGETRRRIGKAAISCSCRACITELVSRPCLVPCTKTETKTEIRHERHGRCPAHHGGRPRPRWSGITHEHARAQPGAHQRASGAVAAALSLHVLKPYAVRVLRSSLPERPQHRHLLADGQWQDSCARDGDGAVVHDGRTSEPHS